MKRSAVLAAVSAVVLPLTLIAPMAQAAPKPAPAPKAMVLTSEQLTAAGFPTTPNITTWGPSVKLSRSTAPVWGDISLSGKAPEQTPVGQVLTMERFYPSDTSGSGVFKPLNITATVGVDRAFAMQFQLGYPGTWGYRVGYSTGGQSPEIVSFQFQVTTTGKATPTPKPVPGAVKLTSAQLAEAGFTKTPNVVAWGGTAQITRSKAPAGMPITISGRAPSVVKPGSILQLGRFAATDRLGSGSVTPLAGVITAVQADQTYSLTFELNEVGVYGYSLGTTVGDEPAVIEFQVKTT